MWVARRISQGARQLRRFSALATLDTIDLSGRQEGVLIERFPTEFTEGDIQRCLAQHDIAVDQGDVLLMRSRLGKSVGRALVVTKSVVKDAETVFPPETKARGLDKHEVELFVEQCERYMRMTDDLRRLAEPDKFLRTVTITDIPKTYGRSELASVIEQQCKIKIEPRDIVWRFSRYGLQSDTAFVVCPDTRAAERVINEFQEVAVPKSVAYGSLMGCSFLWSSRATVFMSNPALEKALMTASRNVLLSFGWAKSMGQAEFLSLMHDMKIFPMRVFRQPVSADSTTAFMMEFHSMDMTKVILQRLHRLKRRWRVKDSTIFYAYPRLADVHYEDLDVQADEYDGCDSDLEEPAHY